MKACKKKQKGDEATEEEFCELGPAQRCPVEGAQADLMSHLMGNDIGYAPGVSQAGVLGVQQEGCFPIRQKAPVFHGPSSKVGDGNQVQLGEGKGNAEQLLEGRKHCGSDVKSYLQVAGSAGHCKGSHLAAQLSHGSMCRRATWGAGGLWGAHHLSGLLPLHTDWMASG